MRVALVYPEAYDVARYKERRKEFPPFGTLYLAGYLEEYDVPVDIIKISHEKTQCDFRGYDVIGFSIPSSATYGIVRKSRFGSRYSESPTIAVGGVHPTLFPQETLADLQADAVAIGNGEQTILEIVQAHDSGDLSRVQGICYPNAGSPVVTPSRSIESSIDWLPLPARHLIDEEDFIMTDRLAGTSLRMAHIMISRGCPFSCRFCAVSQKKVQRRSGEGVRLELEHLIGKYGIEGFAIVDDNFVVNKNMVKDVCNSIGSLGLKWSVLSRVDTVDYELLERMHDAGCIEIKFGVESGSERILRAMGKNISCNQIRQAVTLANAVGIRVKIFLIHGFPGENEDSTRETVALVSDIAHLVDRVSLFRFTPLPGSYVFKHPDLYGLHLPETAEDWDSFHIYENNRHWWGDEDDFETTERTYQELRGFLSARWPQY